MNTDRAGGFEMAETSSDKRDLHLNSKLVQLISRFGQQGYWTLLVLARSIYGRRPNE